MGSIREESRLTLLERLDLAVAERLAEVADQDNDQPAQLSDQFRPSESEQNIWIVGVLGLRGFHLGPEDVRSIVAGENGRFRPEHQEHKLVRGLHRVATSIERRAEAGGQKPDGWFAVESFRRMTEHIDRFRNNFMRRDAPWDAIRGVTYPEPQAIGESIDRFHQSERYGESAERFDALHPVRQAFRVLWRLGRIAPFPEFNLPMAVVMASAYLRATGYPALRVSAEDRPRLENFIANSSATRNVHLESLMLEQVLGNR